MWRRISALIDMLNIVSSTRTHILIINTLCEIFIISFSDDYFKAVRRGKVLVAKEFFLSIRFDRMHVY